MSAPLPVIPVGFFGCGVVGSGTLQALQQNQHAIQEQLGARLEVRRVCVRDEKRQRGVTLSPGVLTTDPAAILDDPEIRIVVEVMGGLEPAGEYLGKALRAGKHCVTANKELLAKSGAELLREAEARRLDLFFEGSVAGGIPILRALQVSLAGNQVTELFGIVNGTTNYILTQMAQTGKSFETALAEAQAQGYAEADPTDDVDGYDAVYKLAILAGIAFRTRIPPERIARQGIREVAAQDIEYARELGYTIKLLAVAREAEEGLELRVEPALIPNAHPLASVSDAYNAVFVRGNAVDGVMFFGKGAGALPTGSSVLGDILEVARGIRYGGSGRVNQTAWVERPLVPMDRIATHYYIRTVTRDRAGVLHAVSGVFAEHQVSLEAMTQKRSDGKEAVIVWVTHRTEEGRLRAALQQIAELDVVERIESCIRVEE